MATRLVSRGGSIWLASKNTFYNLSCAEVIAKRLSVFSATPIYEVCYNAHVCETYKEGTAKYKLVDAFIQGDAKDQTTVSSRR
jgi:hypothetical protein